MKTKDELLQIAQSALADIARSDDLTKAQMKAKALRIYEEISVELGESENTQ